MAILNIFIETVLESVRTIYGATYCKFDIHFLQCYVDNNYDVIGKASHVM